MFKSLLGDVVLDGDHLDLDYRDRDRWPSLAGDGAVRSICFDMGDAERGPTVQLGLISAVSGDPLDWKHGIDPVHHHGSDQFRILSNGGWILANREMKPGDFNFQEAGWVYQERPTDPHEAWMALLMADRRGARSTKRFEKDKKTYFRTGGAGEPFAQVLDKDAAYPHPAGDKGVAAIETTLGRCRRGYVFADADDLAEGGAVTGLLGDPEAGPVVHVVRGGPGAVIVPEVAFATEVLMIVVRGGCVIAGRPCDRGAIRLQAPGAPFDVYTRDDGVELAIIVADRRARPASSADLPEWMTGTVDRLVVELDPVAGGFWRKDAA